MRPLEAAQGTPVVSIPSSTGQIDHAVPPAHIAHEYSGKLAPNPPPVQAASLTLQCRAESDGRRWGCHSLSFLWLMPDGEHCARAVLYLFCFGCVILETHFAHYIPVILDTLADASSSMSSVSNHYSVLPSFAVPHAVQHRLRPSCHRFQRVSFAAKLSSNGPPCSQQSSTPPSHPPYPSLGRTRGSLQRGCNNTAHSACASSY